MEVDLLLKTLFLQSPDGDSLSGDIPDPLAKFLAKSQLDRFNKSAVGDESWDAPLAKTVALPAGFLEHSNQRFEKACAAIRKIFANNPEAAEEAIELARQMVAEARAEVLALAAA